MKSYRFLTADVFTERIFSGNPLAVFPDAGGLDKARMQRIAAELNLSETVFVLPPDDAVHAARLRIFTPGVELPFAGHPTLGAAIMLARIGAIPVANGDTSVVFEEDVGPVPVMIRTTDGQPTFARLTAPKLPERGPAPPGRDRIAELLALSTDEIRDGAPRPAAWSAGVPFLFVPLRDEDAVSRVRFDVARWSGLLASWWAPHVFVLALGADRSSVRARMFAPAMGIAEDPATGGAAVALAGLLAELEGPADGERRWTITQGVEMGRPSTIHVEADLVGGALTEVRVGGAAVFVSEGSMHVPAGDS